MALLPPPHIQASGLLTQLPAFKWGDDPFECQYEVPRLEKDISPLFGRAILALATGMAEWVIWPLSHGKEPVFTDYIEACWAAVVDRRYLRHASSEFPFQAGEFYDLPPGVGTAEDLWQPGETLGRVRGPQFVALYVLELVVDVTTPINDGSMEAVSVSNLAEQVTSKSAAFKAWRRTILKRLVEHHRMGAKDKDFLGTPVPREAMDPDFPYDPGQAPDLIRAFLKGLDPSKNRFLTPAAEMKTLGFPGTPYDF